jgi:hypothetical protein
MYAPFHIPLKNATKLGDTTKLCLCCRHRGDTSKMALIVIDKWTIITPSIAESINLLNAANIEDLHIYNTNDSLTKSYGEKAKYGLIIINLKENTKLVTLKEIFNKFNIEKNDQKLKVCINKNLVEPTDKILVDPTATFHIEVISDKYWIYGEESNSVKRFINFVTVAPKNGI